MHYNFYLKHFLIRAIIKTKLKRDWLPLNKGRLALYIKSNIPVTIKPELTFIRNGIESIFAELTTTNGIVVVGLIHKRNVDIRTENFSVALVPLISSLHNR